MNPGRGEIINGAEMKLCQQSTVHLQEKQGNNQINGL
jgi:hypothetical protein